ncbi:MAG: roadblock/LC7 domain-containing protein [Candidatus Helarchaeota archaeon]
MVDKDKIEQALATIMDQIPEVEGLIAADMNGNVITGQTITAMDHSKIIENTLKVIEAAKGLSTNIEKGSVSEIRVTSDDGFTIIIIGKELIFTAITGTDAASSLGLIVRNLSVALKQL